jgi:hypothetical protein
MYVCVIPTIRSEQYFALVARYVGAHMQHARKRFGHENPFSLHASLIWLFAYAVLLRRGDMQAEMIIM